MSEWTRTTTVLKGGKIEVPVPMLKEGQRVQVVISDLSELPDRKARPQFGSAKGQGWISDDFDAPLEDFAEYM